MTNYSKSYQKCQHLNTVIRPHHYHAAGEYCADCGKWIKWLSKKEYSKIHQNTETENTLNIEEVA